MCIRCVYIYLRDQAHNGTVAHPSLAKVSFLQLIIVSAVSIPKGPIQLTGLLWKPKAAGSGKTPALIVVHPGGGVKEQTASLHARKLADKSFTTLAHDASYQGESGGEPHFLEDPNSRVSDIFAVIGYLQTLDSVDANKISVVGICAGGGCAVAAAKADYRLKLVATISMVNIGDSARRGWCGDESPSKHVETLKFAAQQLQGRRAWRCSLCPSTVR